MWSITPVIRCAQLPPSSSAHPTVIPYGGFDATVSTNVFVVSAPVSQVVRITSLVMHDGDSTVLVTIVSVHIPVGWAISPKQGWVGTSSSLGPTFLIIGILPPTPPGVGVYIASTSLSSTFCSCFAPTMSSTSSSLSNNPLFPGVSTMNPS